ncbi:MAG: V-type ATP synthase subunit E family protein [Candidatus Odinarchaeota archaeon]
MKDISEEADLKKKVGLLGLFMVDKAQQEIKEIQRNKLFQKTEIRKNYSEKIYKKSEKIKHDFEAKYIDILNNVLTSTLIEAKDHLLQLKDELIKDLKKCLYKDIKTSIEKKYSKYIEFIIKELKTISSDISHRGTIIIFFNSRDYHYFNEHFSEIENLFKSKVQLKEVIDEFIGGFKITLSNVDISYDNTINTLLTKKIADIEIEFSNLISDSNYKELSIEFEELITKKRDDIKKYLIEYDNI